MRTISVLVLGMVLCLGAWAADSTIHGLPNGTTAGSNDVIIVDRESPPGTWHNYRLTLNEVKDFAGANTTPVVWTNWVAYGSNYYAGDTNIQNFFSNCFNTNMTASNYFATYVYQTNSAATNVSVYTFMNADPTMSNAVTIEIYANSYASNYFDTNVFPTTIEYHTNTIGGAFIANNGGEGTNTVLRGNTLITKAYGDGGGLTNLNVVTTNLTLVQATTIENETNIFNVAKGGTLVVSNNIHPVDVSWSGPTNLISYTNALQNYTALVPCSITNTANVMAGVGNSCLLCITNASSTNITVLVPATFKVGYGDTNPYTCTNGTILELWFYEASGRKTVTARGFQ